MNPDVPPTYLGRCPEMGPQGEPKALQAESDCPVPWQGPHCCSRGCVPTLSCGFWI